MLIVSLKDPQFCLLQERPWIQHRLQAYSWPTDSTAVCAPLEPARVGSLVFISVLEQSSASRQKWWGGGVRVGFV